jgi:diguanylate cyclase (GGDEF)-like protein/PAS domain S-box-containing protein
LTKYAVTRGCEQTVPATLPLVLVADADPAVRLLAREALELAGFQVTEVADGQAALASVAARPPDIGLLDVMLPTLDGFAACAALRTHRDLEYLPVLLMICRDDPDSIHRAYEVGATDFVVKPIDWAILSQRLRYLLRTSQRLHAVKDSERRLVNAQHIARLGNWQWQVQNDHWQGSDECRRLLGVSSQPFTSTYAAFLACVHPDDRQRVRQEHADVLATAQAGNLEYRLIRPDGQPLIVHECTEINQDRNGRVLGLSGTLQDITDRKSAEEQMRRLAYYDTLTGLPNRQTMLEAISQALVTARQRHHPLAILFLDMDNFKRVNDTLGHAAGDLFLQQVANRLLTGVRKTDQVTRYDGIPLVGDIARLGGDEFIVLLTDLQHSMDAARVAQRIHDLLLQPFQIAGHEVTATLSIGIATYPEAGQDVKQLLKSADIAMYHAKQGGKNSYRFYTESMNARSLERLDLESRLRGALKQDELILFYQPQVHLQSGKITGVEALLRWHNPERGWIMPGDVIPLAEETGLIMPIGEWVVRTACRQNKLWQTAGFTPLHIAVNLSKLQFQQYNLAEVINQTLLDTGLSPQYLELELTESSIMLNTPETIETLHHLKDIGLRLSVDHFGAGYSSLSDLKCVPLNQLKIDRSFLKDVTRDADNAAITETIITIAHSLHLEVLAQGVETLQQLNFLHSHGCDSVQGYLISKPLPAEQFTDLLKHWDWTEFQRSHGIHNGEPI